MVTIVLFMSSLLRRMRSSLVEVETVALTVTNCLLYVHDCSRPLPYLLPPITLLAEQVSALTPNASA